MEKKAIIQNIQRDPSDVEHSLADNTKISKILNWQPKYNIEQGVRETGKWFLDNLDFISSINLKDFKILRISQKKATQRVVFF